jgi:LPXTG-motif cell wall-anchored protein
MLLYVRGEARQVWLRQATSAEIPVQFVDIEGAPILFDELKTNVPLGEINGIDIKQLPMPQGYVAPADSLRFAKHIDAGPGVPPRAQIVTSTAPDAAALRLGAGNELEQWNPNTGWRPSGLDEEVAIGSRHVLAVLPQTGVAEPTPAGAQEVAVFDQTGFAVGQTVVFDPGGPHQEEAVVVGFGSLLLDRPLGFAHDPGEMVTVKPLPATLPRTGGAHAPATGTVAGTLLAAGLALAALARRRRRSARVA